MIRARNRALALAAVGVLSLALAGSATAGDKLKLGSLAPENSSWGTLLQDFGREVSERSNGELEVKLYLGGAQGDEPDMVRKMRSGQLTAGAFTLNGLYAISPDLLVGCLAVFLLGLVDDARPLSPPVKLVMQTLAACWIVAAPLQGSAATVFAGPSAVVIPITIAWYVGVANSVNFLDNMDGSAAGVSAVIAAFVVAFAYGGHDPALVTGAAIALGSCVGFLVHNFPPARIYMGDAGSLLLGFTLAGLAAHLPLDPETPWRNLAVPLLLLGGPLSDTTLVWFTRRARDPGIRADAIPARRGAAPARGRLGAGPAEHRRLRRYGRRPGDRVQPRRRAQPPRLVAAGAVLHGSRLPLRHLRPARVRSDRGCPGRRRGLVDRAGVRRVGQRHPGPHEPPRHRPSCDRRYVDGWLERVAPDASASRTGSGSDHGGHELRLADPRPTTLGGLDARPGPCRRERRR